MFYSPATYLRLYVGHDIILLEFLPTNSLSWLYFNDVNTLCDLCYEKGRIESLYHGAIVNMMLKMYLLHFKRYFV